MKIWWNMIRIFNQKESKVQSAGTKKNIKKITKRYFKHLIAAD